MRGAVRGSWMVIALLVVLALAPGSALAATGGVELLSRAGGAAGVSGNGGSSAPSTTQTGRYTAFLSRATNLTAESVTGSYDQAFVRDALTQTTTLVSAGGLIGETVPGNAAATNVSISDDGRWVVWQSRATGLYDGTDTGGIDRSFARDLALQRTYLLATGVNDDAVRPAISADGTHVAFASHANYDGASGASLKVYVRTLSAADGVGPAVWASRKDGAAGGLLTGDYPRLSGDGAKVAFVGSSPTADPDYPGSQVLLRDVTAHTTTIVSRADGASGTPSSSGPVSAYPAISRDGRYVAFASSATNLSDQDLDSTTDIFRRDLVAGTTTLVSRAPGLDGADADNDSSTPTISDDGNLVLFLSRGTNLSYQANTNGDNAYLRDVAAGSLTWIHGRPDQSPAPQSVMTGAALSGDGRFATFDSGATLLSDQETGSFADVFRRDLSPIVATIADAAPVIEGAAGTTATATFTVTLAGPSVQPVALNWATSDGSATAGSDYAATSGMVAILPGQTTGTITVPVIGDASVEADETFTVTLTAPAPLRLSRATATATIVNDDAPPPAPSHLHTVLGTVVYEPSFAPGFSGPTFGTLAVSPFRGIHHVRLLDASGATLREATIDPTGLGPLPDPMAIDFEFDGLEACDRCTVALDDDKDPAADRRPVSFSGDPGQTDVRLNAGALRAGGTLSGEIVATLPLDPAAVRIRVRRPGEKATLVDSTSAVLQCARRPGDHGARCRPSTDMFYRLSGLPTDGSTVDVELVQGTGSAAVVVDTAEVELTGDETQAPALTAVEVVPRHPRGRVLYGTVAMFAPYAPGTVQPADLRPDPRDHASVELVRDGETLAHTAVTAAPSGAGGPGGPRRTGPAAAPSQPGYELDELPACPSGCRLVVHARERTRSIRVTIPELSPSVQRRDLRYPATGTAEFLTGSVLALQAAPIRVRVTDAASGAKLADSADLPKPCGTGRCPAAGDVRVAPGEYSYSLGKLPPERDVKVTLLANGQPVDSATVTTAPAGETTGVPALTVPVGRPRGRMISGTVLAMGAYAPGAHTPRLDARGLTVRLVDAAGRPLRTGAVLTSTQHPEYALLSIADAPACTECFVELVGKGGVVSDRQPVSVPETSPSTTAADLTDGLLSGGRWVAGAITFTRPVAPADVRVRLLNADTRATISQSSDRDVAQCATAGGRTSGAIQRCPSGDALAYQLGHVTPDVSRALVQILLSGKVVASTTVTMGSGSFGAWAQTLRVKVPGASGRR